MASSRASTPAGRERTAKRARPAKPATRSRSSPKHPRKPTKHAKPTTSQGAKAGKRRAAPAPKRRARSATKAAAKAAPKAKAPGRRARLGAALICAACLVAALTAAYFLWFRDSAFVAVESVRVEGIEGPERDAVVAALEETGSAMTTLHVSEEELGAAVAGFPTVVGISTETDLPHGLIVEVTERPPVLNAGAGGRSAAIAGDGTILTGVDAGGGLPSFEVAKLPASGKLSGEGLAVARIAGAAPAPLRSLIEGFELEDAETIEIELRGGLPVYFGDSERAEEKWAAIAVILANPEIDALTHLDVRAPERPALGGAAPPEEAPPAEGEPATVTPDPSTLTP